MSESKPKAERVDAQWAVDGQDLILRIPGGVDKLKNNSLVMSASGKSESPMNIVVPPCYAVRNDVTYTFKTSGALLYHPVQNGGKAQGSITL